MEMQGYEAAAAAAAPRFSPADPHASQGKALYVGNLHSSVSQEMLQVRCRWEQTPVPMLHVHASSACAVQRSLCFFVTSIRMRRHAMKCRTFIGLGKWLQEIFSTLGPVDKLTGLSAGYGFVQYLDPRAAEMALQSLNGRVLHGQVWPAKYPQVQNLHGIAALLCRVAFSMRIDAS